MISATAITISQVFRKGVRRAGGLQPLIAVLRLFFSSGIPVRPVRQLAASVQQGATAAESEAYEERQLELPIFIGAPLRFHALLWI